MTSSEFRVEVGGPIAPPKFVGLGKEELMVVAGTQFWVRVRWILFTLFWVIWLGMLAGAIVLIINAPKSDDESTNSTDSTTEFSTTTVTMERLVGVMLNLKD